MTKANGKANWRTFKSREEVWAYELQVGCLRVRGLEGAPGDFLVDDGDDSQLVRRCDFFRAYPMSEWKGNTEYTFARGQSGVETGWRTLSKEHTIRIKPAADGLYTDLFHLERDGQLVYDAEDQTKPRVFRQAEIDTELNEGRYQEVTE